MDGKLREVHPNIWRGTLNGWTVEIFHSQRRCQSLPNFRHGVKLARLLIEEWGPAETK
jgi:hypothetical protein